MHYIIRLGILILLFSMMQSCERDEIVDGMRPIYLQEKDLLKVKSTEPAAFENLGKIVAKDNYLFINEKFKGIHLIDNTDPANPVKKYFWEIRGNREFTIVHNVLYAESWKLLLVIDISDYGNIQLLSVIKDQYVPERVEIYPEGYSGYFECYDASAGGFGGWEKASIINPRCKTN